MSMVFASALSVLPAFVFGSGYEFEGVGARQVARCGAVIADSDDWTSLYWNAANAVRATGKNGPEAGFEVFGGQAFGKDSNSLSKLPGVGAVFAKDKLDSHFILGALGMLLPVGERLALGFGVYTPLLQGADFSDTSATTNQTLDFEGSAGIITTALIASYKVTSNVSVGAGANLLFGKLKSDVKVTNIFLAGNTSTSDRDAEGVGLEGVIGVRYDPTPMVSLGAVYRSGSDVSLHGSEKIENTSPFLPDENSDFRYVLRHPPTAGVGVAYRARPPLVLSFDVNRTFWGRFTNATRYDRPGALQVNSANSFDWRNTWKLRWGVAYQASEKTQWQFGYAFDQPALDENSVDFSTTVDVYMNRFSTGVSRRWNPRHETSMGILGGYGERSEGNVRYRLSGWQVMLEHRWTPKRA